MTNAEFASLSENSKRNKLKAALWQKADGCLPSQELDQIVAGLSLNKQYVIRIYRDVREFRARLAEQSGEIVDIDPASNQYVARLPDLLCESFYPDWVMAFTAETEEMDLLHIFIPPKNINQPYRNGDGEQKCKTNMK